MRASTSRPTLMVVFLMLGFSLTAMTSDHVINHADAASGIDISPVDFDMTYVSSSDRDAYALLSSHDPSSSGFTRPLDLYLIDGMRNVSSQISITIQNLGSNPSGSFQMSLVVLHNEYTDFELLNTTINVNSISGGSSTTATHTWAPRYGGNHTLLATTLHSTDDNNANNVYSKPLAIGQYYYNCDTSGSWTLAPGWSVDSAISLSGSSFNVGSGGTSSSYGANWDRSLTSPIFDFSNAHPTPNNYAKIGFFYTGSVAAGDGIRLEFNDPASNSWLNIVNNGFSFSASPDVNLNDGVSWLIQSEANAPGSSSLDPGMIMPTQTLHQQSQFRFRFISDLADNAQGYWLDDVVIIYDEKAWPEEYQIQMGVTSTDSHARRGQWSEHIVTIENTGNVTDSYSPSVSGLPNGWDYQFVHMSGSTILPSMSLPLSPGETMSYRIQIKPGPNAATGPQSTTAIISSDSSGSSIASVNLNTIVDPDYLPQWNPVPPSHYCLPGNSCEFSINLTNIGDGSDTFTLSANPVVQWENWTFDISYNQPPTVTLSPSQQANVLLQADIPLTGLPGQTASIDITATSQVDSTASDTIRVNLTASMISNADVGVDVSDIPDGGWWVEPNETIVVPFTIWNNATNQDTFIFSLDETNLRGWNASLPPSKTVIVNSGETGKIMINLRAPINAQSGDPAPILSPIAISSISGTPAGSTSYSGIRVTMLHDIILRNLTNLNYIIPGEYNSLLFEVENIGNGPEHADVSVQGIPNNWDYYFEVGGNQLVGPISLSPTYESNNIVQLHLFFKPPANEEANIEVEFQISVNPTQGTDINQSDNFFTFNSRTQRITSPVLNFDSDETIKVRTDTISVVTLSLMNQGNYIDNSMRIKIQSDQIVPGITSSLTNGGQSVVLDEWLNTPLPPNLIQNLSWLISVSLDVPVGTNVSFTITFEASDDYHGNEQTINQTVILLVDSHRDLHFTHSLIATTETAPNQRHLFKVNATSFSSFTEELQLKFTNGEAWSIKCDNNDNTDFQWTKVLPSTSNEEGRKSSWDCEFTTPDGDIPIFEYKVTSDNQTMMDFKPEILIIPESIEQGDYFFGVGTYEVQLPVLIAVIGLLFLVFVLTMITAINRKKRNYDDDDDDDDDDATHNQSSHALPKQVQPQIQPTQVQLQPISPPVQQTSSFTDDQFRAAGWTEDKIAEYRRQEAAKLNDAMAAHQVTINQQIYNTQSSNINAPLPNQQQTNITQTTTQTPNLASAFGSLGVTQNDKPKQDNSNIDTAAALASLAPPTIITEDEKEENDIIDDKDESAHNIPKVNCSFCQRVLTIDDQWIECPDCGIFSHSQCREGQPVCARCGSSNS